MTYFCSSIYDAVKYRNYCAKVIVIFIKEDDK